MLWFLPERYKEREELLVPVLPANKDQGQGAEGKRKLGEEGKERRDGMSMGKQQRVKPTFVKQPLGATCYAWPRTYILSRREAALRRLWVASERKSKSIYL